MFNSANSVKNQMKISVFNSMKKTMKQSIASIALGCIVFTATESVQAQYHIRNGDMSIWEGTGNAIHAKYWNSMKNGVTGNSLYIAFLGQCVWQSTDVPPKAGITYSAQMKAVSATLATANGQMTTGRANAGNSSAGNAGQGRAGDRDGNNNYTDVADANYNFPLIGTPDSIRFWAKCVNASATDSARMNAIVHDNYEYHDPEGSSAVGSQIHWIAKATLNFAKVGTGKWVDYSVPFVYNGPSTSPPAYMLITFSTNKTAGGGAVGDLLYVTDVELIYSAWLTDLKANGVTIPNFEKGILNYAGPTLVGQPPYAFPYQPSQISFTTEVKDTVSVVVTNVNGPNGDADGGYTSILVTAEDSVTTKEYRIYYFSNRSSNNDITAMGYTLDGGNTVTAVPGFIPSTSNYTISLTAEEVRVPQIRNEDIVLADTTAEIYRIIQPTSVNSVGSITVRAENYSYKTYTLNFSKLISSNSKLSWIKVGGTDIADFNADTLVYDTNITTCLTTIPTVTAATSSPWATYKITQGTMSNKTTRIVATAENGDSTVYLVNFVPKSNVATATQFRYGTSSTNQITASTGVFMYASSYSFTTAPAALTPTLTCTGATYTRMPANNVFAPDTNYFYITAQDGITTQTYKIVIKNTNCFVATGANSGFRYNYNGQTNQNTAINITTTNNGNLNPVVTSVVTLPIGPNVPPELVVYGLAAAATSAPPTYVITQPKHRNDTATVTLTANDGVTQKIYRVPFKATLSGDANLSNITYNGFNVPGFAAATDVYTLIFPSNVTTVPLIEATPAFQWLPQDSIVITPAATLADTTVIDVTSENGAAKKTYKVAFEVVEQKKDAYLTDIQYDNKTILGFNPTKFNYTVDIPYSAPTPPAITSYASSPTALVFYAQQMTTPPYKQQILVYSEDMTVINIYTVSFNLIKNTDTTLADIKINGVSLQGFNPQDFSYSEVLPYTEMNAPVVSATPTHPFAQVNITQIDTIMGTVTIDVTAEDAAYTATYTINFTRDPSPIIDLDTVKYVYNGQNYVYDASSSGTAITIMLPVETEEIPVITDLVLADNRADYLIGNQPDSSNNFTGIVTVTAEDLTTEMYEIAFQRTLSASTLLTDISYNTVSVPNFDPAISTYYVILPFINSQIPVVSAVADWKNTNISITQPTNPFGQASILVTSEDGLNTKTYTIVFQRKGNPDLVTLSYNLGGTSIPIPNFDASVLEYNVTLPIGTTDIPLLEYVAADAGVGRCVIDTIQQTTPSGTSQLIITTWNQDTTLTYTVNFTVALSTEALLADLQIDGVTVTDFNPLIQLNYAMEVDYQYGVSTLPTVTAVATQPDARVEITQITAYPGTAVIKVYAGDTTISRTYTIAFSRDLGDNNYLSDIFVDEVHLWNFTKNVFLYEVKLPYQTTQMPNVSATAEDSRATVAVMQAGDTANIYVTALNGDKAHYKVVFVVRKNPNALAKMIYVDWDTLEGFKPTIRNYTYILPANYSGMPFVAVELQNPNATYTIIPPTLSAPMQIVVTAEDTDSTFTYRITFNRATSTSVMSYNNQTEVKVYPNPTTGQLIIDNGELTIKTIEIYDVVGQKVNYQISTINEQLMIDISPLPAGIYFLKINDSKLIKLVKN